MINRAIRGISEYGQTRDLPQLIQRLLALTPHVWSINTLKYFPDDLRVLYSELQPPPQVITREKVRQEFNVNKQLWRILDRSFDPFLKHYKANPQNRAFFLCVVWLVTLEHRRTEGLGSIIFISDIHYFTLII